MELQIATTASTTSSEGLAAKEQGSTEYRPVSQARQSEQNGAPDSAIHTYQGERPGDADGDDSFNGKSHGRKRILYPSLMPPHERTEAAKRARAKQALSELHSTNHYAPLVKERFGEQSTPESQLNGSARRRKKRPDAIPFEKGPEEGASAEEEKSTITPSERKVFERLFQAGAASVPQSKNSQTSEEKSEAKGRETRRRGATRIERPAPQFPPILESMAKAAHRSVAQARTTSAQIPTTAEGVQLSYSALHAQGRATSSISKLTKRLQAAESDYQCWCIFTNRLDQFLGMLEQTDPKDQQYMTRLVADILPAVLVSCARTLRERFPGSPLALGVLPALKRAGPRVYALGCSTALYNTHMSILYGQYTDISAVIDLLQEMDREVYPFDDETHAILDRILYDVRGVKEGVIEHLSPAIMMLWSTERMQRAVRDVEKWKDIVEDRRQNEALRLARQKDELEEAVEHQDSAEGWMLKEGEYLSSRRNARRDARHDDEQQSQQSTRKTREVEMQEKIDALLPEDWKDEVEKKRRKMAALPRAKQKRTVQRRDIKEVDESSHRSLSVPTNTATA
nr:hypothetical protein CFP56_70099 [Quercus suber]